MSFIILIHFWRVQIFLILSILPFEIVINWNYIRNKFFCFYFLFLLISRIYIFLVCIDLCIVQWKSILLHVLWYIAVNVTVICYFVHYVWCKKLNVDDTVYWFFYHFYPCLFTHSVAYTSLNPKCLTTKRIWVLLYIACSYSHVRKALSENQQRNCLKIPVGEKNWKLWERLCQNEILSWIL